MHGRLAISRPRAGLYHGWRVVAAAFLVALFGWGLGFYGPGIYLVELNRRHGWSMAELSSAITVYYILGACLIALVGRCFERFGARAVVAGGALAMAAGVVLLSRANDPWQVRGAFLAMSFGWAAMSGAAINIIVAPWFDRRRGFAVSLALNGASAGGVAVAPLLVFLIGRCGFALALPLAAALMLAILGPVAALVLRSRRTGERDPVDAAAAAGAAAAPSPSQPIGLAALLRDSRFATIALPFALGLAAQVGFLTHQVAFLAPLIGTPAAGWAVSLTTAAAILGRIALGAVVDRLDRRAAACGNFLLQALALAILVFAAGEARLPLLYLGCFLYGLSVGNMVTIPGLIVQQEFAAAQFARVVSLVVAINQFTFAFGPGLLGWLRQAEGDYRVGFLACLAMQLAAALIVMAPSLVSRRGRRPA